MKSLSLLAAVAVLGALATAGLVALARTYAERRQLLDRPNARSSHGRPTPRGAGIGFPVCFVGLCWLLARESALAGTHALMLTVPLLLVTVLGWADDHRRLPVAIRVPVQALAVAMALFWLAPEVPMAFGVASLALGPAGLAVVGIASLWFLNAFNFMDGADGYAATQALLACLPAALLAALAGDLALAALAACLAGTAAGFLAWNWPPARIFMGDAGSYALGLALIGLALAGEQRGTLPALVWTILLAPFVWDASLTLLWRLARGEAVHQAHRAHAYQLLLRGGLTHRGLVLRLIVVNVAVAWPLAAAAALVPATLPWAFLGAALIMTALWTTTRRRLSRLAPEAEPAGGDGQ